MSRALMLALLAFAAAPAAAEALAVAPAPTNPNSACAVGNPCSLDHAVQIASSGDQIVIPPGAYSLTVQRNLSGVDVHGVAGQPAPQIVESNNAYLSVSNATLRHVGVLQSSGGGVDTVVVSGGTLEDAVVRCAPLCHDLVDSTSATIKDVVATSPSATNGIETTGPTVVRNVTILMNGGGGSDGIKAFANGLATVVDVRNTIVRCTGCTDLAVVNVTPSTELRYGWSDVRANALFNNGGTLTDLGHNVAEEPLKIVDQTGGDAHLLADSALIDAGTADQLGDTDLDGGARIFGGAPDIGADEMTFPSPAAVTGDASAVATTTATIAGTVTPSGATTYRFEWGTTTGYGQQTTDATAGNGSAAVPVSTGLTGLAPDTVYHYRVVATSPYGTANGIDKVLRTAAVPAPQPPAAFTGALATTRSAKIDKHGRFSVTLACPASAVTACTGTARLGLPLAKPVKFLAAPGKTARVRMTLTPTGRRLVGARGLKTNLVVLAKDGAGREHAQVRALRLRRR